MWPSGKRTDPAGPEALPRDAWRVLPDGPRPFMAAVSFLTSGSRIRVAYHPMPGKIYFITGGARSGKSQFAESLANGAGGKRAYLATAQALDAEMVERIERHRRRRGSSWDTYEEPLAVADLVRKLSGRYSVLLLDCLTLWLSNVIAREERDEAVLERARGLADALAGFSGTCIVVSNEVGLGIVPDNRLARRFRDLAGVMNQLIAQTADEAYFLAAGLPMRIK